MKSPGIVLMILTTKTYERLQIKTSELPSMKFLWEQMSAVSCQMK